MRDTRTLEVAIGIICRRPSPGKTTASPDVLISRRAEGGVLAGYWEFPGGKLEPRESPEACVVREIREELGVTVRPLRGLEPISHDYAHGLVRLWPFFCEYLDGEPQALEVAEWRWVNPGDLKDFEFPQANAGLIQSLITEIRSGDVFR